MTKIFDEVFDVLSCDGVDVENEVLVTGLLCTKIALEPCHLTHQDTKHLGMGIGDLSLGDILLSKHIERLLFLCSNDKLVWVNELIADKLKPFACDIFVPIAFIGFDDSLLEFIKPVSLLTMVFYIRRFQTLLDNYQSALPEDIVVLICLLLSDSSEISRHLDIILLRLCPVDIVFKVFRRNEDTTLCPCVELCSLKETYKHLTHFCFLLYLTRQS